MPTILQRLNINAIHSFNFLAALRMSLAVASISPAQRINVFFDLWLMIQNFAMSAVT